MQQIIYPIFKNHTPRIEVLARHIQDIEIYTKIGLHSNGYEDIILYIYKKKNSRDPRSNFWMIPFESSRTSKPSSNIELKNKS